MEVRQPPRIGRTCEVARRPYSHNCCADPRGLSLPLFRVEGPPRSEAGHWLLSLAGASPPFLLVRPRAGQIFSTCKRTTPQEEGPDGALWPVNGLWEQCAHVSLWWQGPRHSALA